MTTNTEAPLRYRELLLELKKREGSIARLAHRLQVSERSVRGWLKKEDDRELVRLHPRNLRAIRDLARDLGVSLEIFEPARTLWDIRRTYKENLDTEPPPTPEVQPLYLLRDYSFLGFTLSSPFGAAASVLTSNAKRIHFLAHSGCNIITHATVRPHPIGSHPHPTTFFCSDSVGTISEDPEEQAPFLVGAQAPQFHPAYGLINRFGLPSPAPEDWIPDFRAAKASLQPKQLLILSVLGTTSKNERSGGVVNQFRKVVQAGAKAGAEVIELNLGLPSLSDNEISFGDDLPLTVRILRACRKAAPTTRLLAKLSFMPPAQLQRFVGETAEFLDGYSAISEIPGQAVRDGMAGPEPAFGMPGLRVGLAGKPIRRIALSCVEELARLRERLGLGNLGIVGMGGVSSPSDVQKFLNAGADVVQATSVFFSDPYFGLRVLEHLQDEEAKSEGSWRVVLGTVRLNLVQALEQLDSQFPRDPRPLHAAMRVFLDWKRAAEAAQTKSLQRVGPLPTREDFRDRILQELSREPLARS